MSSAVINTNNLQSTITNLLRISISSLMLCSNITHSQRSVLDSLIDITQYFIEDITNNALNYAYHSGRCTINIMDIIHSLNDYNINIIDLIYYIQNSDNIAYPYTLPAIPQKRNIITMQPVLSDRLNKIDTNVDHNNITTDNVNNNNDNNVLDIAAELDQFLGTDDTATLLPTQQQQEQQPSDRSNVTAKQNTTTTTATSHVQTETPSHIPSYLPALPYKHEWFATAQQIIHSIDPIQQRKRRLEQQDDIINAIKKIQKHTENTDKSKNNQQQDNNKQYYEQNIQQQQSKSHDTDIQETGSSDINPFMIQHGIIKLKQKQTTSNDDIDSSHDNDDNDKQAEQSEPAEQIINDKQATDNNNTQHTAESTQSHKSDNASEQQQQQDDMDTYVDI